MIAADPASSASRTAPSRAPARAAARTTASPIESDAGADDTELDAEDLRDLAEEFKELIYDRLGVTFPEDPNEQLWSAITAVFGRLLRKR